METLRCLIADIPQKVLADIVHRVTHLDDKIEVVGQVPNLSEIPEVLGQQKIDVLVIGMRDGFVHAECQEILHQYPNLLVIGLVNDGRMAVVCLADLSSIQLVDLISNLGKQNRHKQYLNEQDLNEQKLNEPDQDEKDLVEQNLANPNIDKRVH